MKIAGQKSDAHWKKCKNALVVGGAPEPWQQAFNDFFVERLHTRYLAPIEAIQALEVDNGEGFSIVAIQCSLIEFLGAALEGKTYRYNPGNKLQLGEFEYGGSKDMFVQFLTTTKPFQTAFVTKARAADFYKGVRCALLHEARTCDGWTIKARSTSGEFIDFDQRIVWRDDLQVAFTDYIAWYGSALSANLKYQAAFIRKFDSLCEG